MEEGSGKGSNLDASHIHLRTREIASQFRETSCNGAMEKSSRKGSNLDASHSLRLIVVDLGVDEGDRSTTDVNTSSLRQHSTEGSGKLPSMGRWRKVPGNVQMLGSHSTRGIRVNFAILKLDRAGSVDVNTSSLQHQIPQVNSRKLPSTGRWGNVPGKVQIWRQSHAKSLIVVDLGVDEGDRSTTDGNTSSLRQHSTECSGKLPSMGRWENVPGKVQIWLQSHILPNMGDHTSVPGNFPQRGDGGTFRERFKYVDPTYVAEFE
jgi:hypothetical protein